MRVLAIDWGLAVGMAVWDGPTQTHDAWVSDWDHALDVLTPTYVYSQPTPPAVNSPRVDLVACEDYVISTRTVKTGVAKGWKRGRELMLIGATEFMCRQTGVEFCLQTPAEAKEFADDAKLKRIGWYTSSDHSRDASRHLLLALVRRRQIDPRTLLSP